VERGNQHVPRCLVGCTSRCNNPYNDVWLVAWIDTSDFACETDEWVQSRYNASTVPARVEMAISSTSTRTG
jgi:hypothetical protein